MVGFQISTQKRNPIMQEYPSNIDIRYKAA